ncbi:MAG TPA: hypothetical protein VJH95_00675, partial [Candidatus Nanoarchaeia archaeon]|nr:hypothetical protein [Candidatus Nanoarchaeia archaeon]
LEGRSLTMQSGRVNDILDRELRGGILSELVSGLEGIAAEKDSLLTKVEGVNEGLFDFYKRRERSNTASDVGFAGFGFALLSIIPYKIGEFKRGQRRIQKKVEARYDN